MSRAATNAQVQEVQEEHSTWRPSGGSYGWKMVLELLCLYSKPLCSACVVLSLTCVPSAVGNRLTTLNFTNTESNLFAESVTVLFLFRTWTDCWKALAGVLVSYTAT